MNFTRFFDALAAHSPLIYFCYRPSDHQVVYVSAAYETTLGGQVETVNEQLPSWWAALHPDDQVYLRERLAHVAAGATVQSVQLRLARPDGGTRWLCLRAYPFLPEDGTAEPLISGYLEDITGKQAILENANRYQAKKDSMLEILSHDLASPLTQVEQMADYLADKTQPLADAELDRMIGHMRRTCQEGVSLIRDFVDQEFLESSNVDLSLVRLDLAARLQEVFENYRQRQHAAGHQFSFKSSHPRIYVEVDDNKFLQVINNLIGNALKFTPDGGQVQGTISQHPTHVLVTIADNGVGIPDELQAGLFDRFTRARRVGLRGEKTTGLGMSIIKTIVELHQGRIWCESEEGRGSTFTIQLPLPK